MSHLSSISYIKFLKNSGINTFLQNKPKNLYETNKIQNILGIPKEIKEVNSIKDLNRFIKNSNIYNLKKQAKSFIISDGNEKSDIMIIGDYPEASNNKLFKPFANQSEQLLNKMLNAINLKKTDVYLTNVIPWICSDKKTPTNEEILGCLPFIQRHIEIISPKIIILLGSIAAKMILNSNLEISKMRGKWHEYKSINFSKKNLMLVTYHPNFLLNNPSYKKHAWEDLKMLKKKLINAYE